MQFTPISVLIMLPVRIVQKPCFVHLRYCIHRGVIVPSLPVLAGRPVASPASSVGNFKPSSSLREAPSQGFPHPQLRLGEPLRRRRLRHGFSRNYCLEIHFADKSRLNGRMGFSVSNGVLCVERVFDMENPANST